MATLRPKDPTVPALAFAHSGHVAGTFFGGSRNDYWEDKNVRNVAANLAAYKDADFAGQTEYSSAIGATLETLVGWALKTVVGGVIAPLTPVIFIGVEIGSLISTGSLVPGARVLNGVLWMAGPSNTLFAIAAEAIADVGSRSREITQEEYNWANEQVFKGALPPREKLILTDQRGAGHRAFTFPRYDGKITLNMGPDSFDDPREYEVAAGRVRGETFIHELVHACQIDRNKIDLAMIGRMIPTLTDGQAAYDFPPAGPDYTTLGLEQQAEIVSCWFAGRATHGSAADSTKAKDEQSPYFTYIQNNVRLGRY